MSTRVLEAIAVTAEMTGTQLSGPAVRVMEMELAQFDEAAVLKALRRCMRELKHRLTLADVIERLEGSDGRPTADEAWAIAIELMDEAASAATTDEIMTAWGAARPIYADGDRVGARMAFRAAYDRAAVAAREAGKPVAWRISFGTDKRAREMAVRAAVEAHRLTHEQAGHYLPAPIQNGAGAIVGLLAGPAPDGSMRDKLRALRDELRQAGAR